MYQIIGLVLRREYNAKKRCDESIDFETKDLWKREDEEYRGDEYQFDYKKIHKK
jgi:hypothetical protein